jgi:hypothetical protein
MSVRFCKWRRVRLKNVKTCVVSSCIVCVYEAILCYCGTVSGRPTWNGKVLNVIWAFIGVWVEYKLVELPYIFSLCPSFTVKFLSIDSSASVKMWSSLPSVALLATLTFSSHAAAAVARRATSTTTASSACTVTAYTDVPSATASCTAITLDGIHVPGNDTLNLSQLKTGTTVTFAGTTTFGYANADYNMIEVGGTDITVTAATGAIIDGNGQAWWDGQGSNGGITKPDHFFVVNKLLGNSVIENLHIQNCKYPRTVVSSRLQLTTSRANALLLYRELCRPCCSGPRLGQLGWQRSEQQVGWTGCCAQHGWYDGNPSKDCSTAD